MARFYLIDNSLKSEGGHHFDYDRNVLAAAEQQGFEPILASHRRFRMRHRLPSHWKVRFLFPHSTYSRYSFMYGGTPALLSDAAQGGRAKSWLKRLQRRWRRWRADSERNAFAAACARLFDEFPAQRGDIVYFPTMGDMDLAGLAQFLRHAPAALDPDWHFQFHRSYPIGERTGGPERGLAMMRDLLEQLAPAWRGRRMFAHATTDKMARRFAALQCWPADQLDHAVDVEILARRHALAPRDASDRADPLRLLLAGGTRPEKGSSQLARLLEQYERRASTQRSIQIWVQTKRPRRLGIPRLYVASLDELRQGAIPAGPSVVALPHPLSADDYYGLFAGVDAGLCLHDPRGYQERCSGVLVELLAAGLPVLVPDACWLAEEVGRASQGWSEACWRRLKAAGDAPSHALSYLLDGPFAVASRTVELNASTQRLVVRYARLAQHAPGCWLKVSIEPVDQSRPAWVWHIPDGPADQPWTAVVPWNACCQSARVSIAGIGPSAGVLEVSLELTEESQAGPCGAVGLAADGVEQFVERLREFVDHFDHFRTSAREHGLTYAQAHHPSCVIDRLRQLQAD